MRAQLRLHWGRVMSVLVFQLGDLQRADAALSEAVEEAVNLWPQQGSPAAPVAWLVKVARRRAVDQYRRELRHQEKQEQIRSLSEAISTDASADLAIPDMRLQLMLTCSHPVLEPRVRIVLLLYSVCGLDVSQIAQATFNSEIALAQQIARAKKRLRKVSGAFLMPSEREWQYRRDILLESILGVYRAGYTAEAMANGHGCLSEQGLWLSQLVLEGSSKDPEVLSLAALLQMTQACAAGRFGPEQEGLPMADQDHRQWDCLQIARAKVLLSQATEQGEAGGMQLQACITAEQVCAIAAEDAIDWSRVLFYYQTLYAHWPSAEVALGAAVALSKAKGAAEGLAALEQLSSGRGFRGGPSFFSAQADMLLQLGQRVAAQQALTQALACPQVSASKRLTIKRSLDALNDRSEQHV